MTGKKVKEKVYFPYARLKAVEELMEFIKTPGWRPSRITKDVLQKMNIAPNKETVALGALKFLGLISPDGKPTDTFDKLKEKYSDTLYSIVRIKYSLVFELLPENLIDQDRIVSFFMKTTGTSRDTAEYQGMLFGWLCKEAGIELPNLPSSFSRARFK